MIDWILKTAYKLLDKEHGIVIKRRRSARFPEVRISDLDYADDLAAMDETSEGIQKQLQCIARVAAIIGLKISIDKTKIMEIVNAPDIGPRNKPPEVELYGKLLDAVRNIVYLGSNIADNGSIKPEIEYRIGKAAAAYHNLHNVWRQKHVSTLSKMKIFNESVRTCLLYSSDAWNLTDSDRKKLDVFEMSCLRSISGIRKRQHKTNKFIREKCNQICASSVVEQKQLTWFGHVTRMDEQRIPKLALMFNPIGKRRQGRPKSRWIDNVASTSERTGVPFEQLSGMCSDRKLWRAYVASCTR